MDCSEGRCSDIASLEIRIAGLEREIGDVREDVATIKADGHARAASLDLLRAEVGTLRSELILELRAVRDDSRADRRQSLLVVVVAMVLVVILAGGKVAIDLLGVGGMSGGQPTQAAQVEP